MKITIAFVTCLLAMLPLTVAAQGVPFTNNDLALESAINSQDVLLDVLSNDDSGVSGNDYKEVIGVCSPATDDADCTTTTYTDGVATILINGPGDNNNILMSSNNNSTHQFDFKYIMQNIDAFTGSALGSVDLSYIEVNDLTDSGNGNCDASSCTLRDAMSFGVNDNEPTTISFQRDLQGTISLSSTLTVDSIDLAIMGPGASKITLSGNDQHRVLHVPSGSERFTLAGLTISSGFTSGNDDGAGILIENALDTQIDGVRVIDNDANDDGGGIYINNASVSINNTEVSNNQAGGQGGGIAIRGGFGYDVSIENTTISSNASQDLGSGLFVDTTGGHNLNLRFITAAYNPANLVDNRIEGTGNVFIESSLFAPGLSITNANNITHNSIFNNLGDGSIFGDNNLTEVDMGLNTQLIEINQSGLYGHTFDTSSLAYNHVDDMVGNSGCGTEVLSDQFGQGRPEAIDCDAGAYEYRFVDVIFATGFE